MALPVAAQSQDFTFTTNSPDTNTVTITGYTGLGGAVDIPSNIVGKTVSSIGQSAFRLCASLTSVTIPDSVSSIENLAFNYCDNLAGITMGNSVADIGSFTFYHCISLTNITIPASVTNIGMEAFSRCDRMTEILVDASNSAYGSIDGVLYGKDPPVVIRCPGGKTGSHAIPDGVTIIGVVAFADCTNLTNITIPDSVSLIGLGAFAHCVSLANVTIGRGVASIEEEAFIGCSSLANIAIPASVTHIGNEAFSRCYGLTGVYFNGDAPSNGSVAFWGCTNSTIYYLPGTESWPAVPAPWADRPTALWLPETLADGSLGVQAGQFGFNVGWADGKTVVMEATTNLTTSNWVPVVTKTLTTGTFYFGDAEWAEYPGRFYRSRSSGTSIRHQPLMDDMPFEGYLSIDINDDGMEDIYFYSGRYPSGSAIVQIVQIGGAILLTTPLSSGLMIDSNAAWRTGLHGERFDFAIRTTVDTPFENGPWAGVTNAYLPMSFMNTTNRHYGWIWLEGFQYTIEGYPNDIFWNLRLKESAYETIPDKGILTGQTE